jgi:hypothetical protein
VDLQLSNHAAKAVPPDFLLRFVVLARSMRSRLVGTAHVAAVSGPQ